MGDTHSHLSPSTVLAGAALIVVGVRLGAKR
jgi:hypothetical protein